MNKVILVLFLLVLPSCYVTFGPAEPMTCEWVEETHCYDFCYDKPYCEKWCDWDGYCNESCWYEETCEFECAPQHTEYCY